MSAVVDLLLAALAAAGAWLVSLRLFPWKDCPRCKGARRIASGSVHRDCGRCGATGRVRRIGAGRER